MIDFSRLEQYRENNRIEAKCALGGLPHSIWETYSAFANTLGGVILLGVEEDKDKSLHPLALPDPEGMAAEFWTLVNDPAKASVNILADHHVRIEQAEGKRIIAITVPRAPRTDRPVYVDGDPLYGTYRRNGEGDYRCTREEVESMRRDAARQSRDMTVLEALSLTALNRESLARYRACMEAHRRGHGWEEMEPEEFLCELGAGGRGTDGAVHPTAGGLLFFGHWADILRVFPQYALSFSYSLETPQETPRRTAGPVCERWQGNLWDFYQRVSPLLAEGLPISVHEALREALANALTHADYDGQDGLVVVKTGQYITVSNPGSLRVGMETARSGGVSDPRNAALARMLKLVGIGEGVGIPGIYSIWKAQGWPPPVMEEHFAPERITLSLPLGREADVKTPLPWEKHPAGPSADHKSAIVEYLTDHVSGTDADFIALLGLNPVRVRRLLTELRSEDVIVAEQTGRTRQYRLKS